MALKKPRSAWLSPSYVNTKANQLIFGLVQVASGFYRMTTYFGTRVAPKPTDMAAVRMKRFRRVNGTVEMIRIPDTATAENRKVVIPPRTEDGIDTSAAANLENMPMTSSQKQQAYPAVRLAHRVKAMTPLFCAKVDMGVMVQRPAMMPFSPSANTPPWIRESNSLPSTWRRETSQVAVISPIASIASTM